MKRSLHLPAGLAETQVRGPGLGNAAAVTQNFCSPASLPLSVEWMARGASSHLDRLGITVPQGTDGEALPHPGENRQKLRV